METAALNIIMTFFATYEFLKKIWANLGNIESFLNISVMACAFFMGVKSFCKRKKLNKYLRKWLARDTVKSLKYYIDTRGQQVDPCNYDEIGEANNCALNTKLIPFFIKTALSNNFYNQYFILLGDSGTGKTTFLIQLFKAYQKRPWKKYKVEFIPLLHKGCMNEICSIKEPSNTILLLDGIDENPDALDNYEEFIKELLEKTELFYKIIMTCRTQFFPNEKGEPKETGRIRFDTQNKKNEFYKIYMSPFDSKDIKHFLKKKYPFIMNSGKRKKAMEIINKTPYLMVRPMLLSYIDDLLQEDMEYEYIYQIYMQLTEKWMQRENIPYEKLNQFTHATAVYMYRRNSNYIESQDIEEICQQYNIDLREIDAKSRSLLNRNGLGDYKFAHKSIYEYILAKEAIDNLDFREEHDFSKLDMAALFFREMSSMYIKEQFSGNLVAGNFTKMCIENIDFSKKKLFATFKRATLDRCFLDGCELMRLDIDYCVFKNCALAAAVFAGMECRNVSFEDCHLADADCHGTVFVQCSFTNCDMRGVDLIGAKIIQCEFNKSNLAFSKLNNAAITNCTIKSATLGPLEYENLQADPQILKEISLANKVAEIFINNGFTEAKKNGVKIVTNPS